MAPTQPAAAAEAPPYLHVGRLQRHVWDRACPAEDKDVGVELSAAERERDRERERERETHPGQAGTE